MTSPSHPLEENVSLILRITCTYISNRSLKKTFLIVWALVFKDGKKCQPIPSITRLKRDEVG